jgi:hypothetical protein
MAMAASSKLYSRSETVFLLRLSQIDAKSFDGTWKVFNHSGELKVMEK